MGNSVGQFTVGNKTGAPRRVSADGFPEYVTGGVTFNWSSTNVPVAGVGGVELADGTFVPEGVKYMRYGQAISWPVGTDAESGQTRRDKAVPVVADAALVRDRCAVLNETVVENEHMSNHAGGPLRGGRVFRTRLLLGNGTTTGPTLANLILALPHLSLVED